MSSSKRKTRFTAVLGLLSALLFAPETRLTPSRALAAMGGRCGTSCMMSLSGYCPACNLAAAQRGAMPWGGPPPFWWQTGALNYSNFYSPAPWYAGARPVYPGGTQDFMMRYPSTPGIMPGFFPGGGHMAMGKPNLYLNGPVGTEVSVKLSFVEKEGSWLASVPSHGTDGWKVTLAERGKLRTSQGAVYGYLFSDYRSNGLPFQERQGFCSPREKVVAKLAITLKQAQFDEREIADFIEYWSVKLPPSKSYCVYPQDERQLNQVAPLEITPKPVAVRRVLFVIQVEEGLAKNGGRFSARPTEPWSPQPVRMPAASSPGVVAREWGVSFMFSQPKK